MGTALRKAVPGPMPRDDERALRLFLKKGVALMKKRGLSLFLALALCLSLLPATAWAAGEDTTADTWNGTADTSWYTGHENDLTFTLTTAAQLAGLAQLVNGGTTFSSVTITLGADIDLNEDGSTANNWTPIGTGSNYSNVTSFQGTFDGQGHTIKGLYIQSTSLGYAGLFGRVNSGTVKNLAVEGVVNASLNGVSVYVGGVVGYNNGGTVETCSFTGAVSGSGSIAYVGGVVGQNIGTVKNCCHTGEVTATANSAGYNYNAYAGGVVGTNVPSGRVENCYHRRPVTATGTGSGSGSKFAGGVVGYLYSATVSNCYFLQDTDTSLSGIGYDNSSDNSSDTGAEPKTANQFASGEVAWLLSGGDENSPWRQNLASYLPTGSTAADDLPTLDSTHLRVTTTSSGYTNTLGTATGEDSYYEIYSAAQLYAFASAVNGGQTTINAKLMDDIDLSSVCGEDLNGGTSWTPIGSSDSNSFQGTFDGQGHTIKGLYIKSTSFGYVGLFGCVGTGGTVKNLAVEGAVNASFDSYVRVGGVVGSNSGGTVETCSFTGAVSGTGINTSAYVGGVVGSNEGTVKNCCHTGQVKSTASRDAYASGVVGDSFGLSSASDTINCYHTGTVTSNKYAGGVVGHVFGGTVSNCYFLQEGSLNGIGWSSSGSSTKVDGKDSGAFASGEVAWLLQNGQESTVWVQNLAESGDEYPVLAAFSPDTPAVHRVTFTAGGTTNSTYYRNAGGTVTVPDLPEEGSYVGWYIGDTQYNVADTITVGNSDIDVVAKTNGTTPSVDINYKTETLSTTAAMEYSTDGGDTWTACTDDMAASTFSNWDGSGEVTVQFRTGSTATTTASDAETFTIPARPAAPAGITAQNETITGLGDGQLTGTTEAMEYSTDGGETWTTCTVNMTVTSGTYLVRYAATDNAFASETASVTVGANIVVTTPDGTTPTYDETGNVTLPGGSTVQTGDGPEIKLPNGGEVAEDGSVTAGTVEVGDTTITAPEGETVTTAPDGDTTAPGGSTVEVGDTTITIGEDTNGATVDENGKITLPGGGTVTVETGDGEPVTITTPAEDGTITVNKGEGETTLTVPDGTTVQTGTGPEITLPEGGKVAEDGSVTAETVQVGDTTITAPESGNVTTNPDGTTTAPGGSTVEIGETKITVGEDTAATVDQTGSVTLPEGGTVTVTTGEGQTATITVPETGGTVGVDDEGNLLLPGGSTVTIDGTESTIPESGGALDPATGQITYNTYLVTFNSQGGSQVAAQTVTAGGTVKQPTSPTKAGYTFAGWYRDAACQTPWNFTTDTVTGNLTLYAKWMVKSTTPTYTPTVSQPENGTVTITPTNPKQGATVTVTPKPDAGYEVDTITVTDKNGSQVQVTDNGDGTYRFTQPASRVTVAVTFTETKQPAPDLPFTDVDSAAWYAEAVSYMLERGLMTGTAPDTFSPNSTTTRAMIVTILYRLEGAPGTNGDTAFTDVERGTWYTDPIAWAAANGVVEGTTPTTFAPNAPVTREQMATILYRYLAAKGYDVTARADLSDYTDANQVSSYATEAMSWANALGLITGDTPATLTPQASATRAQVATILMRFCGSIER